MYRVNFLIVFLVIKFLFILFWIEYNMCDKILELIVELVRDGFLDIIDEFIVLWLRSNWFLYLISVLLRCKSLCGFNCLDLNVLRRLEICVMSIFFFEFFFVGDIFWFIIVVKIFVMFCILLVVKLLFFRLFFIILRILIIRLFILLR